MRHALTDSRIRVSCKDEYLRRDSIVRCAGSVCCSSSPRRNEIRRARILRDRRRRASVPRRKSVERVTRLALVRRLRDAAALDPACLEARVDAQRDVVRDFVLDVGDLDDAEAAESSADDVGWETEDCLCL